jgi:amino acid transporter
MKKVFLFMLVGVIAILLVIVSLMNFDPKTETWGSFIGGVIIALLIVKSPTIIAYFKSKK